MTRPHTLINLRNAERRLTEAVKEIKSIQSSQDYELDLEFFKELTELIKRYGYDSSYVADLLIARDPNIEKPAYPNTTMLYVSRLSDQIDLETAPDDSDDKIEISGESAGKIKLDAPSTRQGMV